jgi:hypothetical protein
MLRRHQLEHRTKKVRIYAAVDRNGEKKSRKRGIEGFRC